jgi:hypothetical protein
VVITEAPDIDLLTLGTSPKVEYMHGFVLREVRHGLQPGACDSAVELHARLVHNPEFITLEILLTWPLCG